MPIGHAVTIVTFEMRSSALYRYFADIVTLKGVGPMTAKRLSAHIGPFIRDLLFFKPTQILKRLEVKSLSEGVDKRIIIKLEVAGVTQGGSNRPLRVQTLTTTDEPLQLVFFKPMASMTARFTVGSQWTISGKLEKFGATYQITHPDIVLAAHQNDEIDTCEAVYSACEGLSSKTIRRTIAAAITSVNELEEWSILKHNFNKLGLSFNRSIDIIHHPQSEHDIDSLSPALLRLAYDEALSHQLAMKSHRRHRLRQKGIIIARSQKLSEWIEALPFALTTAQNRALDAVLDDFKSGHRANRLIQGDVGSGKTVIALQAAFCASDGGFQTALMAPTEILARQHLKTVNELFPAFSDRIVLLTGHDNGGLRAQKLKRLKEEPNLIVIGTHALFQYDVFFKNLSLVIIDEQHRFGVGQRQKLLEKGNHLEGVLPHLISMSATPIPRTLALTNYGECDLSIIDEKPLGRKPVLTALVSRQRVAQIYERLGAVFQSGMQAYWVCPLVEETEKSDLMAVQKRFAELNARFQNKVGLIHGRMKPEEKERVVQAFLDQELQLLCATTVIEVGVNVPNASIMIIEQAERFGLAQLHQLRGRVGRGNQESSCVLLYDDSISKTAKARLETLRYTENGFEIAEMDWKIRGQGDLLGAKQSGFPDYHFVDPTAHQSLIETAAKEAQYIMDRWETLTERQKENLKILLQLFDWHKQIGSNLN